MMRRRFLAAGLVTVAAIAVASFGLGGVAPAVAATAPYDPANLAHVGQSAQVIVVTSAGWGATTGTLRAYERDANGGWREVVAATPARLGWTGMIPAAQRRQGSGKTPAGTFAIPSAFGRLPNPGTQMPYLQFDRNDAWPYSHDHPATYNVLQTAPVSWASYGSDVEILWKHGVQYRYAAVLDYNLPAGPITRGPDGIRRAHEVADTHAGGGIFLHVTDGTATAGCIAIPESTMRDVLRWLDPHRNPVIVVGPEDAITRM
jgi:L,D-peptidoglycan transpeptidase YkuD (ErfK/YbiS/YcfS/YnhG family)